MFKNISSNKKTCKIGSFLCRFPNEFLIVPSLQKNERKEHIYTKLNAKLGLFFMFSPPIVSGSGWLISTSRTSTKGTLTKETLTKGTLTKGTSTIRTSVKGTLTKGTFTK